MGYIFCWLQNRGRHNATHIRKTIMHLPAAPGFADYLIDCMIKWFDDVLGVRPIPRDEEGIDYDQADGRFTLRFETPVHTPKESYINEMEKRLKFVGWTFHWPVDDDDVLEISMDINDMHMETNQLIKDLKK